MFKRPLTHSDIFLIAANLLPVYGVLFLGWSAAEVFIVYALETVIVGFFTLLKLGILTVIRGTDTWYNQGSSTQVSGLFFMLFFFVHYGFFVAVQMTMFQQVSNINTNDTRLLSFFLHWPSYIRGDIAIMLSGFVISYGLQTVNNFILNDRYRTIPMMHVMFQPYGRIFVQQFTVILGSIFLNFGAGKIFILIFAVAKIYIDVYVNLERIIDISIRKMERETKKSGT